MTNTLPDLRVTIAESMEALADARLVQARRNDLADLHGESTRWWSAKRGAETLRWCAERERPSYEELAYQLAAALLEAAENDHTIEGLVANVRFAVSKWEHGDACPAGQLEARGDAVCDCALVERRQSALDAVA